MSAVEPTLLRRKRRLETDADSVGSTAERPVGRQRQPQPKKQRNLEEDGQSQWPSVTPTSRMGLWTWPCALMAILTLNQFDTDFLHGKDAMLDKIISGVELSTDFSGVGCAEHAGHYINAALRLTGDLAEGAKGIAFSRCGDINSACRKALRLGAHDNQCIFGNAQDRLPDGMLHDVKALWHKAQTQIDTNAAGKWFLEAAAKIMLDVSSANSKIQAWCFACRRRCPLGRKRLPPSTPKQNT